MITNLTYIQQLNFDGTTYRKGGVCRLDSKWKIVCQDFPFKRNPKPKELPSRDWAGEDGLDVYIPQKLPVQSYDIEVPFLYVGTEEDIRTDIASFIDYLYGRNAGAVGSRLAIYNTYADMGRKDVVVSEVNDDLFFLTNHDPDAVARFKVKFTVHDPTTELALKKRGFLVTDLVF